MLLCTSPAVGATSPLRVGLHFAPQETLNSDAPNVEKADLTQPIRVADLVDARADKPLIGENRERGGHIPVLATNSVADLATGALRTCLAAWGMRLDEKAALVLKGEIAALFVTEENRYNADLTIRFRLEDAKGVLWEGMAVGKASTWGHSLSPQNYNQVISDGLRVTYANLMSNPGFQRAWSGRASDAAEPAMSPEEMKAKVQDLMKAGVATDIIVGYVTSRHISRPLAAEEILDWKKSGIQDEVIRAALPAKSN